MPVKLGPFIHYFLDSKIWHVRHDQRLDASLQMAESQPA
jgi:hypothetical protein